MFKYFRESLYKSDYKKYSHIIVSTCYNMLINDIRVYTKLSFK